MLRTLASQVPAMRAHGFDAGPIDSRIEAIKHIDWRARNQLHSVHLNAHVFCERAALAPVTLRRVSFAPSTY